MSELLLMGLPASMSASLEQVAEIRQPLMLLTRHSIREQALGDGFAGYALPLTEQGRQLAQAWGAALLQQTGRRLHSCISSPIQRCLETASLMRAGQAQLLGIAVETLPPIEQQLLLVEPGGFVYDVAQASTKHQERYVSPGGSTGSTKWVGSFSKLWAATVVANRQTLTLSEAGHEASNERRMVREAVAS